MDPRHPAVPVAAQDDEEHVLVNQRGETRRAINLTFTAEDTDRIRTGYCCLRCGESQVDHGAPFPPNCWVCRYPMKERQARDFAFEFRDSVRVGPSTTIDEELEIARMLEEEKLRKRELLEHKTGIVVPSVW